MQITAAEIRGQLGNAGGRGGEIEDGKVVLRHEGGRTIWAQELTDGWSIFDSQASSALQRPEQSAPEIARALWSWFVKLRP